MLRKLTLVGGVLVILFVLSVGPVQAGRLGGAYRGPYEDNQVTKNETSQDVTSTGKAEAPKATGGSGDQGKGDTGAGDGGATPPPGDGGDTGGGSGGGDTAPPTDSGGSSGSTAKEPTKPTGGQGGLGGNESGRTGKTEVKDVLAYWPFWFEHNKEWLLEGIFKTRSARAKVSPKSSPGVFMRGFGAAATTPVTEDQRVKVIFPLLVKYSTDPSSWVRDAAVLALGKLGIPEAVKPIAARLNDKDPDVVQDACLALGLTRDKAALEPLVSSLNHVDRRPYAALGLGLLGRTEAVPALLAAYGDAYKATGDERAVTAAACIAVALGGIGDQSVVNELAAPLRRQKVDKHLLMCVCQALGRLGGETALDWLRKTVTTTSDKDVQAAAILALANYSDKSVAQMILGKEGVGSSDRMTKLFSLIALGQIGSAFPPEDPVWKKAEAELRDAAEGVRTNIYNSMYGALGLAILGADSLNKFFQESLIAENRKQYQEENHTAMAIAVGLLEARNSVAELRSIVSGGSESPDYRGYAAFALGLMGDRKSADVIRGEMRSRQKAQFLRSCCWALGMIGDKTDTDLLINMLKLDGPENHPVRGAAAVAIGLIGDTSMVDPLVKVVQGDANTGNKAFAIAALGCLIDRSPVPRLPQLFSNIHFRQEMPEIRAVLTNL